MKRRKGFTLVEVLIVVIIITCLASLIFILGRDSIERMRSAEAIDILSKCYAGYQRVLDDGEVVSAARPLNWSRLGMTNPNLLGNRFFTYTILNNDSDPVWMFADRGSAWLRINMSSGCISKTQPY